jgi:hypothetical protein
MPTPFIGREALDAGRLTRHELRSRFVAVYPGVYFAADAQLTARDRAKAAWLWSKRRGILAGRSAAAMHGTKWIDPWLPAEILHDNRHAPRLLRTWADAIGGDDVMVIDGIPVTTPARTALDIACRYPLDAAITAVDALANATRLKKTTDLELLVDRYKGRRGLNRAREVFDLVDPGAESPRETRLRLLFIRAGYPPPETQIPVYNEFGVLVAVLDMGWRDIMVAADYEGDHHRSRDKFNKDLHRFEEVTDLGWTDIRVTSRDTEGGILQRMAAAWARRATHSVAWPA